jgi:hypothetical protein
MRALSLVLLACAAVACAASQRAAAKDPMKCERDPSCANHLEKTRDCATQCSDDPACMDRCREGQPDSLGHK